MDASNTNKSAMLVTEHAPSHTHTHALCAKRGFLYVIIREDCLKIFSTRALCENLLLSASMLFRSSSRRLAGASVASGKGTGMASLIGLSVCPYSILRRNMLYDVQCSSNAGLCECDCNHTNRSGGLLLKDINTQALATCCQTCSYKSRTRSEATYAPGLICPRRSPE